MKIRDFLLERYFSKYEFRAPYLLCSSDCESFTVNQILEMEDGPTDLQELWLGYTETLGHPELREQIVSLYQTATTDDIIVTSGAEEAIFIFMNVALKPGDHIIYMWPAYQSLHEIARSIGCEVTPWKLKEDEGWEPDLNELEAAIQPNTKAIIINTPHNPTGYLMAKDTLQQVVKLARKHDLYLFSDEVYRLLEYKESYRLPAAVDCYEKAVSLGVMSKSFGLAGLRIGWIVSKDQELLKKFASFKDYTSICNSAPSEYLAILALKNKELILERNLEIVMQNQKLLTDFFSKYSDLFYWQKRRAGVIAFPRLLIPEPVEEFCVRLVEEKGVLLLPGNYYDAGDNNFRIGYGRRNMPKALQIFDEYLHEKYR